MRRKRILVMFLCCFFAIGFISCGGGTDSVEPEPENSGSSIIRYENQSTWVIEGNTVNSNSTGPFQYGVILTLIDKDDLILDISTEGPGILSEDLERMTKTQGEAGISNTNWSITVFVDTIPAANFLYTFHITTSKGTSQIAYPMESKFIDFVTNTIPVDQTTISEQPVFSWDGIAEEGAEYSIILKKISDLYGTQVADVVDAGYVTTTTWQCDEVLEEGDYVWTVNAYLPNQDGSLKAMSMSKEFSFTLSTEEGTLNADITSPTISSTTPVNNSTGVEVNSTITATFSEAMNSDDFTSNTFTISDGVNGIRGEVTYSNNTASFTPIVDFIYDTTYIVTLSGTVTDLAGNMIGDSYIFTFTTGSISDTTPPAVTSTR